MIVGIVGVEQKKLTLETEKKAREIIRDLLSRPNVDAVCSGHCHLGGIDIIAEEVAKELGVFDSEYIFAPKSRDWHNGYRPRNLKIAEMSDEVTCITLRELPASFDGMKFPLCYHCGTMEHIKSGGCWTVLQARKLGKKGHVIVI